jgi:hypothetical protein
LGERRRGTGERGGGGVVREEIKVTIAWEEGTSGHRHDMRENEETLKLSGMQHDGNMRRRLRTNILNEWLRFEGDVTHCRCRKFN